MHIFRRTPTGPWWIDLGQRGGGPRNRYSLGTKDRTAAEEAAAKIAHDHWRTKRLDEAPSVTWDEAVLSWLQEHQHLKSLEEVKRVLRWLTQHLRGVQLSSINGRRIQDIAAARRAYPANSWDIKRAKEAGRTPPPPRKTSPATLNRHMAQLSAILHYAHRREWITAVPHIPKAKEPAGRTQWATREQAARLVQELPKHLAQMARFGFATGLRETNIRELRWSQVDMAQALCWHDATETKSGRPHATPLGADALQVLAEQRGQDRVWVFPVETRLGGGEVAIGPTGKMCSAAWKKAAARAGIPWFTPHYLRHTWASWHRQAGTPEPVLQALGDWSDPRMVQKYAHLGQSHIAAWASNASMAVTEPVTNTSHYGGDAIDFAESAGGKNQADQQVKVGWLMGLEPTTTRITNRDSSKKPSQINNLRTIKPKKAA